jgi:biopolymer transport protein ExbB
MEGMSGAWSQGDLISRAVALLLLAMSVSSWVLILWKGWLLRRAGRDIQRGVAAFWSAATVDQARERLKAIDREAVLEPLVEAALRKPVAGTLETQPALASQLTRRLRDALHAGLAQLQFGQVVLASVGSTAPFIGLFGTVWGIFHALGGMAEGNGVTIEKIAGPVGEALIFTAAGLAVAIPAVLAYNIFGKRVSACEADLEGFAHDLREMRLDAAAGRATHRAAADET